MKKLLLTLLALLCLQSAALAEGRQVTLDGIRYTYAILNGESFLVNSEIIGDVPPVITLPQTMGGCPLTRLGECSLWLEDGLAGRTLVIPESVEALDSCALGGLYDVRILLPSTVQSIGESFEWSTAEIVVSPENHRFTVQDGFLIDTLSQTLLYAAPSAAENPLPQVKRLGNGSLNNWHAGTAPVLPDTLTSIGAGVFSDCVDITELVIPAGVTEIGNGAFNCVSVTEITLPPNLTEIPPLMLSCSDLTEIAIPETVTAIHDWAFYLVPLSRVEIPAGCAFVHEGAFDPEVELVLLGEDTFVGAWEDFLAQENHTFTDGPWEFRLTDAGAVITGYRFPREAPAAIIVPDTLYDRPVVGVDEYAFNTNDYPMTGQIGYILLPEGLRFLAAEAFGCCHYTSVVLLPASLETIAEGAFRHCSAELVLHADHPYFTNQDGFLVDTRTGTLLYTSPSGSFSDLPAVRRIGSHSLENWGDWSGDVVIPEGVEELAAYAFYDEEIRTLTLPASLRLIETSAFECVLFDSEPQLPASLEVIQYGAFGLNTASCNDFTALYPPSARIETIEEYALRTGDTWVLEED